MFKLEFILSRSCNQQCVYCTTYKKEKSYYVDIEFIKQIINDIPKHSFMTFEISGGEPGLCLNLLDIIEILQHRANTKIHVLSNGLVRINYPEIINSKKIMYFEHLLEYPGKKFYDLDYFENNDKNNFNVFVVTEELIDNFNYPINKNTWYKMVNIKSPRKEIYDKNKFKKFFNMIQNKTYKDFIIKKASISQQKLCSLNSPTPFINIENHEIGHCTKILNNSLIVKYSKKKLLQLLQSKLFVDVPPYCYTCNDVAENRIINIIKSNKHIYTN